jgi:hypothetical protein
MNCIARTRSTESEWCTVSEASPCAICGSGDTTCSENAEESFASGAHGPADWLLTNGAWLHAIPAA